MRLCPRPSLSFPYSKRQIANWRLAISLQTDTIWSISKFPPKEKLMMVLLPVCWWSPGVVAGVAWGQEGPSGQWRTGETSSCPLPQWLPVLEEREQEGGVRKRWERGRSVKGRWACGAMKNTLLWLLYHLVYNTTESSSCRGEKLSEVNHVCDKKVHHPVIHTRN